MYCNLVDLLLLSLELPIQSSYSKDIYLILIVY